MGKEDHIIWALAKPDHLGPVEAFAAAPFAMMGLGQNREESNGESSLFQVPTQVRIK